MRPPTKVAMGTGSGLAIGIGLGTGLRLGYRTTVCTTYAAGRLAVLSMA